MDREEEKKELIGETPEEQMLIEEMRRDGIRDKEIERMLIIQRKAAKRQKVTGRR